jgi:sigma-E factor negative regulatory protein RseB
MKNQAATFLLVALLLDAGLSSTASADPEATKWLEQMSAAISQMTYQGTFVYFHGDDIETMRITHVADENGVRERLVSVSGAQREVLRDSDGVRWVLGDYRAVLEDPAFSRSFFPEIPFDEVTESQSPYKLSIEKSERIAGHTARKLNIEPKDRYRYGYRLWLEENSFLILKWELIGDARQSLARLMFTDLRLGSEVDIRELKSQNPINEFNTLDSGLPSDKGLSHSEPKWKPSSLPPGFRLTSHRYQARQEAEIFEHLVYSDGLAAVSVYIESSSQTADQEAGMSKMGTTHAYTRYVDGLLVTVVGDVPAITVKSIGNAVSLASQ